MATGLGSTERRSATLPVLFETLDVCATLGARAERCADCRRRAPVRSDDRHGPQGVPWRRRTSRATSRGGPRASSDSGSHADLSRDCDSVLDEVVEVDLGPVSVPELNDQCVRLFLVVLG